MLEFFEVFEVLKVREQELNYVFEKQSFRLIFLLIRSSIYICTFCDLLENQKFVWNGGLEVGFLVAVEVDIGFNSHHGLTT